MSRAHRLIELLQELRARRRPVTAEALAAALGVSRRTLYRDIASLRAQGAQIEGEAGLGYVLRPGFMLPPLMFTPEELEAILLGTAMVAQRQDLAMAPPVRAALAKIAAVVPAGLELPELIPGLIPGPARQGPALAVDARAIRGALRGERRLRIAYVDGTSATTERVVWPVAIGVLEDTQLLAAWCELRGGYRHFRMDRIRRAEVLEVRMPRRRPVLYREWRAHERACLPASPHELG